MRFDDDEYSVDSELKRYHCSTFFATRHTSDSLPQWISLILLIHRLLAVCYCAAKVADRSSETIAILNCVSPMNSLSEIKHFQEFLSTSKNVLTGLGYFSLTKGLILTVSDKELFSYSKRWQPNWVHLITAKKNRTVWSRLLLTLLNNSTNSFYSYFEARWNDCHLWTRPNSALWTRHRIRQHNTL